MIRKLSLISLSIGILAISACTARAGEQAADKSANYSISVSADPNPVKAGADTAYKLEIAPKGEYVLKTQTPFKAQLSCGDNVSLAQSSFSAKDFTDAKSPSKSISTTFKASAAGAEKISADLSFFLCTEKLCERYTAKVPLDVPVK